MGPVARPTPAPGRRRFQIRGQVNENVTYTEGWWIFAETHHGVQIKLDDDQMRDLRIKNQDVHWEFGEKALPDDTIEVYMPEGKLHLFPVGTVVKATFAQAGQIEQFFEGRIPLALVDLVPVGPDRQAENQAPSGQPATAS